MNAVDTTTKNQPIATERCETVIVGGGQAGLALGYELRKRGRSAVILDAHQRVGDAWRKRWDSLSLFTPAKFSALPGKPHEAPDWAFLTKDEFADYLEGYAREMELDVRPNMRVRAISRADAGGYLVEAADVRFVAEHVVLATGAYPQPVVPSFAPELAPEILQMHSSAYRNPGQLQDGDVLVVGAGNTGCELAVEFASTGRTVHLAGKAPLFPTKPGSLPSRVVMPAFFFIAMHLFTAKTPMGRRMRPRAQHHAAPVLKVRPSELKRAGVHRVGRIAGIEHGKPVTADGETLEVSNVLWCTGFRSDFSWIDLPSFQSGEEPAHRQGVLTEETGVYLIGQRFQYALASSFIGGVGRDAAHVASVIAKRLKESSTSEAGQLAKTASA